MTLPLFKTLHFRLASLESMFCRENSFNDVHIHTGAAELYTHLTCPDILSGTPNFEPLVPILYRVYRSTILVWIVVKFWALTCRHSVGSRAILLSRVLVNSWSSVIVLSPHIYLAAQPASKEVPYGHYFSGYDKVLIMFRQNVFSYWRMGGHQ